MNKQLRKRAGYTVSGILLAVCVGIMIYPLFADAYNRKKQSEVISGYEEVLDQQSETEKEEMLARCKNYNEGIRIRQTTGLSKKAEDGYRDLLNGQGGIMGYLTIPSIHFSQGFYHGTDAKVLENGVGHLEASSLPVGGEGSHAVLTGHTGMASNRIFTDLENVKEGDEFCISVLGEKLYYRVNSIRVVLPHETESLLVDADKDLVTLVTCTPFGINSHRLLVTGERILEEERDETVWDEGEQEEHVIATVTKNTSFIRHYVKSLGVGVITGIGVFGLVRFLPVIMKKKRGEEHDGTKQKR